MPNQTTDHDTKFYNSVLLCRHVTKKDDNGAVGIEENIIAE